MQIIVCLQACAWFVPSLVIILIEIVVPRNGNPSSFVRHVISQQNSLIEQHMLLITARFLLTLCL